MIRAPKTQEEAEMKRLERIERLVRSMATNLITTNRIIKQQQKLFDKLTKSLQAKRRKK